MAIKDNLRTEKATIWWRWWDEAEHKSSPEKRLAFYDALMRYIFRGDIPPDPTEMDDPTGIDYAAYDATHYFDVIDSLVDHPKGGAPIGNQNARKKPQENNQKQTVETTKNNPLKQPKTTGENKGAKQPFLRMKNEERRMKNEEEREIERDALSPSPSDDPPGVSVEAGNTPPTVEDVLKVAKDAAHRSGCEEIPEDFARDWHALMETSGWRDTRGKKILPNGWRGKLAFAWRDEKRRRETENINAASAAKGGINAYHEAGLAESAGI